MSFIGSSRCPRCEKRGDDKSGNNLAEYSDNYYCWKCGYTKQKKSIESYLKRLEPLKTSRLCDGIKINQTLAIDAKKWLLGYQLTDNEIAQFSYATEREYKGQFISCELLILLSTQDYWLGRNFGDGVKYLSSGNKPFKTYGNNKQIAVFVEDVISAVKVGRVATAIPMLGASVPIGWWQRVKEYDRVILWGDRDKAVDNARQARRASELLGKNVELLVSLRDPKDHNTDFYNKILKINN